MSAKTKSKPNWLRGRVIWGLILLLGLVVGGLFFYRYNLTAVDSSSEEETTFVVFPGEGIKSVSQRLKESNLIRNQLAFLILAYQENLDDDLQAGDFLFSSSLSANQIAEKLTSGSIDVWVTIIPGSRAEEVALVLADSLSTFDSSWLSLLQDQEGYLMPDSYLIPKDADWEIFWSIINNNYQLKVDQTILTSAQDLGLNEEELVILASLVEREADNFSDQQAVAGVLLNRLNNGWPLQIDATVQYALANQNCRLDQLDLNCDWWPKVTSQDTKTVDSIYNTYLIASLPAGPICSPSSQAIEAVSLAQPDSPYWYYISDLSGQLHLAKDLAEHEENINLYLN